MTNQQRPDPARITWLPVHPDLPEWRSFWSDLNDNQLYVRTVDDDPGGPRITHLLLLGHDIRTADIQEIRLGRILQMINTGAPHTPGRSYLSDIGTSTPTTPEGTP
jgi:hypothetical protein